MTFIGAVLGGLFAVLLGGAIAMGVVALFIYAIIRFNDCNEFNINANRPNVVPLDKYRRRK